MAKTIISKQCGKCKEFKSVDSFYKDVSRNDGLNWACKQCEYIRHQKYRHSEKGKITNHKKCLKYHQTPQGRQGSAKYRKENQEKIKAQHAVGYAIHKGSLVPPKILRCNYCFSQAGEYHHASYAPKQHLIVVPVCALCHKKLHRKISLTG